MPELTEEEIVAKIAEARAKKQLNDEKLAAEQLQLEELNKELERIKELFRKKQEEGNPIRNRMQQIKNDDWAAQKEIERLQRLYEQQKSEKNKLQEESDRLHRQLEWFETLAKVKAWGPHAFGHQRDAAIQFAFATGGFSDGSGSRAICGDQMGLGKTMTCLIWLDVVKAKKVAIFTPKPVLKTFLSEIGRWAPHRDAVPLGLMTGKSGRDTQLDWLEDEEEFTILVNYEAWRRDKKMIQRLIDLKIDTVICDEAHVMADKNGNAFKGISELVYAENDSLKCNHCGHEYQWVPAGHWCKSCMKTMEVTPWARCSVKNVMTMSGTLIKNKPQDFWPQLYLWNKAKFYKESDYLNNYCMQVPHRSVYSKDPITGEPKTVYRWEFLPGAEPRLINLMGPGFLQRNREAAGITLPPQERQTHYLEFDSESYLLQQQAIEELTKYYMILIGGDGNEVTAMNTIAQYIKLRLLNEFPGGLAVANPDPENMNKFLGIQESIKLDYAVKLVEEAIASDKRTVVFSHFKTSLVELNRRLIHSEITSCIFAGGVNEKRRAEIVNDFNRKVVEENDGKYRWDVVCANYRSGGVGLNLTAATNVICLGEEWSPKMEAQALARVDRIGQTQETSVQVIRIRDTIDEWMGEIMDQKKRMGEDFDKEAQDRAFIKIMKTKFKM